MKKIKNWKEKFWKYVDKKTDDECWNWKAGKMSNQYGQNGYGDFYDGIKTEGAHRTSFKIHKGEIPKGKYIMHICDNRSCVNPKHLKIGTQSDNMWDWANKKRIYCKKCGQKHYSKGFCTKCYYQEFKDKFKKYRELQEVKKRQKEWEIKNKEKIKKYNHEYWKKYKVKTVF